MLANAGEHKSNEFVSPPGPLDPNLETTNERERRDKKTRTGRERKRQEDTDRERERERERQRKRDRERDRGSCGCTSHPPQPHCIGKLATVRQDRECWVVAQGRSITGPVAVWRSPVVGPADLQIWTARPWPKDKWAIPNNCIVCSTRGPGLTALGGGDFDGDTVFVSANVFLLNYLDATEAAVRAMATADAARVKERLAEDARTPWEAATPAQEHCSI